LQWFDQPDKGARDAISQIPNFFLGGRGINFIYRHSDHITARAHLGRAGVPVDIWYLALANRSFYGEQLLWWLKVAPDAAGAASWRAMFFFIYVFLRRTAVTKG
jgi:hypothetical protein